MDGPELYTMLAEELETESLPHKPWELLHPRVQRAWAKLARRLDREHPRLPMLSTYPD